MRCGQSPCRWRHFLILLLFLPLGCCGKQPVQPYSGLSVAAARGELPRCVAVLPFENRTAVQGLDELVRSSFYAHLSVRPYRDVELQAVDRSLHTLEVRTRRSLSQIPVEELGRILGCDAVISGVVTTFERIYAGLYSQMAVGASILVRDTRDGRKIWSDHHVVRYHEGGIPLNPVSIPLIGLRSGMNLRGVVKMRAVDELARYLAWRLPAPKRFQEGLDGGPAAAYELQVGAFLERQRALRLLDELRSAGFPAFIRLNRDQRGLWHRVLLGPYEDSGEALELAERIRQDFGAKAFILSVPSRSGPR